MLTCTEVNVDTCENCVSGKKVIEQNTEGCPLNRLQFAFHSLEKFGSFLAQLKFQNS